MQNKFILNFVLFGFNICLCQKCLDILKLKNYSDHHLQRIEIKSITKREYKKLCKNIAKDNFDTSSNSLQKIKDQIIIKLKNGEEKVFQNFISDDITNNFTYSFVGYVKEIGYYIILVKYYETGKYLLINEINGEIKELWGLPKFSKDFVYVICSSNGLFYDEVPNGIQLYRIENKELFLVFEVTLNDCGIENVFFDKNNNILIKLNEPDYKVGKIINRFYKVIIK